MGGFRDLGCRVMLMLVRVWSSCVSLCVYCALLWFECGWLLLVLWFGEGWGAGGGVALNVLVGVYSTVVAGFGAI